MRRTSRCGQSDKRQGAICLPPSTRVILVFAPVQLVVCCPPNPRGHVVARRQLLRSKIPVRVRGKPDLPNRHAQTPRKAFIHAGFGCFEKPDFFLI